MVYIGIDPGKKGGIGIIRYKDGIINTKAYPLTNETLLDEIRNIHDECICCLEKVHAMPNQGVTSTFTFGEGFGFIKGVLSSYNIPYQEVPPKVWKKEFSLNDSKEKSIAVCRKLFPQITLLATDRCKTPHDGMAEALLMAEYAKRKYAPNTKADEILGSKE